MAQQQGQPPATFHALKPATWGQLRLIPDALRSKLAGPKGQGIAPGGKENAPQQLAPQAPPKLQDLSHLKAAGPRRQVSQRYALQPNLNVARPLASSLVAIHGHGASGLVAPGSITPTQHRTQSASHQQQRPSTPSSPTLRGRQPFGVQSSNVLLNPNFVPTSIPTRLPTPVRINSHSLPGTSASAGSPALLLPKPPSPSRSLSQGGDPANSGSSACTVFSLPAPPPLLGGPVRPLAPRAAAAMPWAAGASQAAAKQPTIGAAAAAARAAAPSSSTSILASLQVIAPPPAFSAPSPNTTPTAFFEPSTTPTSAPTVDPAIQAALQKALAAAVARKPEGLVVDNFEQLFDSMMHPRHAGKLDGPLPDELPDDLRYSDAWLKHCRDWNVKHKTSASSPYVPPPYVPPDGAAASAAAPATPGGVAGAGTPNAGAAVSGTWSLDEPQLSEACQRALDIAHRGLRSVLTPASSTRSASILAAPPGTALAQAASAPLDASTLSEARVLDFGAVPVWKAAAVQGQEGLLEDTAESRPAPSAAEVEKDVASRAAAAALASRLEGLARERDQDCARRAPVEAQPTSASASTSASPLVAPQASAEAASCSTPDRAAAARVVAVVDGHETPVVPTAAEATISDLLSPTPTRTHNGSTGTSPGAASTVAASAAATPIGGGGSRSRTAATTPATAAKGDATVASSPGCEASGSLASIEALLAAAASSSAAMDRTLATAVSESPSTVAAAAAEAEWNPTFPAVAPVARAREYVASPVTLMHGAPRDLPTPNPGFLATAGSAKAGAGAGTASLVAAIAAVAAPQHAGTAVRDPAGPSTSTAPPPLDPLKEIVLGIEKLSSLKHQILAEDKEVDVAGITNVVHLKLAVEQLLKRTTSAVQAVVAAAEAPPAPQPAAAAPPQQASTPAKLSRSASIGAFFRNMFSPKNSASKAAAAQAPPSPSITTASSASAAGRAFGNNAASILNSANGASAAVQAPASPAVTRASSSVAGAMPARPASASAVPRRPASPCLADKERYAALHQRAAARLAQAATEPASILAAAAPQPQAPAPAPGARGDLWQRYEQRVSLHRQQLDATRSQLDEAVRKLHEMQTEFDELLLCLGMESAKNKALCDAMRAAGLDPEPILAAIEDQWMAGQGEE
ncbi:hypothetical protein HYH03_011417 [Edaphochlamys debaryana]|uniref:Uncharacterized protein n=1 Tax=Edaphochlamys debaryana TaxID=47281 RepID=A0A835XU10_9CHLO|nr:hypothetical protein HYH03_011417 [Edaphochlamys debaryana]|eukprot:KAG2490111.1 hypothetical protein HYH03_011417 [Edaphochlamys debaryana]